MYSTLKYKNFFNLKWWEPFLNIIQNFSGSAVSSCLFQVFLWSADTFCLLTRFVRRYVLSANMFCRRYVMSPIRFVADTFFVRRYVLLSISFVADTFCRRYVLGRYEWSDTFCGRYVLSRYVLSMYRKCRFYLGCKRKPGRTPMVAHPGVHQTKSGRSMFRLMAQLD
jgi:hypothetical protein